MSAAVGERAERVVTASMKCWVIWEEGNGDEDRCVRRRFRGACREEEDEEAIALRSVEGKVLGQDGDEQRRDRGCNLVMCARVCAVLVLLVLG